MQRRLMWLFLIILALAVTAYGGGGTPSTDGFSKLTAQVVDASDNPISDLVVRVEGQSTGVTTDSTGTFELESGDFPNGVDSSNELSFGRNGVIYATYELVPSADPTLVIKFGSSDSTTEYGGVSGMVYDIETEEPLGEVDLSLFSEDGGVYSAVSGLDGYDFVGIPPGTWTLAASKTGYYSEMAIVEVTANETTVQNLAMTPNGTVTPGQGLLVSGTLIDSKTGDPVANATISMYCDTGYYCDLYVDDVLEDLADEGVVESSTSRGASMASYMYDPSYQETTTDEYGHFTFEDEIAGYMIWLDFYADGYLNGSYYQDIYGQSGELSLSLTMESYVETSASGTVVSETGDLIPGAYVELIYAGDIYDDVSVALPGTGVDWEEAIELVDEVNGSLTLPAEYSSDQDGWDGVAEDSADSDDSSSSSSAADNAIMMRYRWENQQSAHGTSSASYFTGYYATNADENGAFSFESLPAGTYYLFVSAYGYLSLNEMVEIAEDATENVFEFTIEEIPVGAVEGVVTDEDGNPIPDCLVNATQPDVDPFTYTDENGYFLIENVPTGTWFISGYKTGYLTESVEQVILEDRTVVVNLTLETYTAPDATTIAYSGEVIDSTDASKLPDADLVFTPVDNTLGSYYQHVVTDSVGAYSCTLVPTEYNVLVQVDGYEDVYIRIWVDSEWPTMDFWMWPINYSGGDWGGWIVPMDDTLEGDSENVADSPTTGESSTMPDLPRS